MKNIKDHKHTEMIELFHTVHFCLLLLEQYKENLNENQTF